MESQESESEFSLNAGNDPNPATESLDLAEVARADVRPSGAAAASNPPQIPLAPMKRVQARFNPLADGLMYLVVFVGGFVGVGCRRGLDMLLPSVNGTPFVVGTFVSNMLACFLFAMLTEYMATASWLRRRVRQAVSRGVGLGFLGGLSTMSGVMLEMMEGLRERHVASAFGYLAGSFVGGIVAALAGVLVMRWLLAKGTQKRVRDALFVSDSPETDNQRTKMRAQMSDSPESDKYGAESTVWMSDSGESDILGAEMGAGGVKHVKVADVAHSAAQAALEAAQIAQRAAQQASQAAQSPSLASQASPILTALESQTPEADTRMPASTVHSTVQLTTQSTTYSTTQYSVQPSTQPIVPSSASADLPSFEPKPVTAEIPMVPDPTTGEVH
ncbi:MAG: CrcB family protein [Bifidobacterium sp.]|nr:CrcB family protein [Bifidobacterium sp.]